jgi:hypothetical protein
MLANRVEETTATTGSGSFTTSGAVAGFVSFYDTFGLDRRFKYWAVNDTDTQWEAAIGYLSDSTTLVRETVTDNSAGTLVAIVFTTAPSLFCGPSADDFFQMQAHTTGSLSRPRNVFSGDTGNAATTVASREYYFLLNAPFGGITSLATYINSAAASGSVGRFAVYTIKADGFPGVKIAETSTFATDSTGGKDISITLPKGLSGWMWVLFITDGAPTLRDMAINAFVTNDLASNNFEDYGYRYKSGSGSTAPDPASTALTGTLGNMVTIMFGRG